MDKKMYCANGEPAAELAKNLMADGFVLSAKPVGNAVEVLVDSDTLPIDIAGIISGVCESTLEGLIDVLKECEEEEELQ